MRIGLMLRAYDEQGGIGVYTRNLVEELLRSDSKHEFIFFYRSPELLGRFAGQSNVVERYLSAPNKLLWDQVAIPLACKRESIDLLFHPKFTAPLLAPCTVMMAVHGADWFIPEQAQFYHPLDVRYVRLMMPWYIRKCRKVISVSQLTTENFNRILKLPPDKMQTVYFGPARHFRRVEDSALLSQVRERYGLPEKFILTLTKRRGGDRRKNLGQVFQAYAAYHQRSAEPHKLVIGGKDCHLFKAEYDIPDSGYGSDILFPGWIDQADLPAVYSLAQLYLYPSRLEAFPIPLTEAMACGTAIITSNSNGLEEIAGDAALLVDPEDTEGLAEAICRVLSDEALRLSLSERGLERSTLFSWERCARQMLDIFEAHA